VIGSLAQIPEKPEASPVWTLADSWIWARINGLVRETERLFSNYQYGEAGRQIYEFFWSEFADWYLEIAKTQLAEGGDRAYYTALLWCACWMPLCVCCTPSLRLSPRNSGKRSNQPL